MISVTSAGSAATAGAALAGAGHGEGSAVHLKYLIGLDAGGSLVLCIFRVVSRATCCLNGGYAAVEYYKGVGSDAFFILADTLTSSEPPSIATASLPLKPWPAPLPAVILMDGESIMRT